MRLRLPFRYLEPTIFSGLLDDPLLLARIRPLGRSILIDCGQIHHLAKRVVKSLDAVFVSHAHMDHFMGVETLTRNVHISPRTVDLYGPPGIAEKMTHKLAGYDWNLREAFWGSYRVHEVGPETIASHLLSGPEGFACRHLEERPRRDRTIYRNGYLTVEAEMCDHKIPVLAFKLTERPAFAVDEAELAARGLVKGPWLATLKKKFCEGALDGAPVTILRRCGDGVAQERIGDGAALYREIRRRHDPASIGYVTDIAFSEANLETIRNLMRGVTLLVCECSYLAEDRERARKSAHLCTTDVNTILKELRPAYFVPMHLSKNYLGLSGLLYRQLEVPPGTTLLRLPEHVTPRPLLPGEVGRI
ncbi:MAG: ribonuclease Z [Desulfuromonas sp.]|uniref:ribonuclease Z n=1 Tax=Desulfuromonas sp. TaxID=892 RepID=UPI000CC7B33A|nr:MBL fold metallo-hydrolase [Desulfuromonas sp.]PLX86324.1 MAG: ribonuclease Z [Desulfuromonas sp.]